MTARIQYGTDRLTVTVAESGDVSAVDEAGNQVELTLTDKSFLRRQVEEKRFGKEGRCLRI